jgi:hypothetical protein
VTRDRADRKIDLGQTFALARDHGGSGSPGFAGHLKWFIFTRRRTKPNVPYQSVVDVAACADMT